MFCKQCGKEIEDNARFCCYCGTPAPLAEPIIQVPLIEAPTQQETQSLVQSQTPLTVEPVMAQCENEGPAALPFFKKSVRKPVIIASSAVVILGILICVIIAFVKPHRAQDDRVMQTDQGEAINAETEAANNAEEIQTEYASCKLTMNEYYDLMNIALSEIAMSAVSTKKETKIYRYDIYASLTNEKYGDVILQGNDDGTVIGISTAYTKGRRNVFNVTFSYALATCFTPIIPYVKNVSGSSLSYEEITKIASDTMWQKYTNDDYHHYSLTDVDSGGLYLKADILGVDCAFIITEYGDYASLACGDFFSAYESMYGIKRSSEQAVKSNSNSDTKHETSTTTPSSGNASGTSSLSGYYYTTDALNVRTGPGTGYSIIKVLPVHAEVYVTGIGNSNDGKTWASIQGGGYVCTDYLIEKTVDSKSQPSYPSDPCKNGHTWIDTTETIHHDEIGHYESVIVKTNRIEKYKCPLCTEMIFLSLAEYYNHFDNNHTESYPGDPIVVFREQYTVFEESQYDYEEKWVIDSPAWDETIVSSKCSVCGKTR